jgi:hypothetical protein
MPLEFPASGHIIELSNPAANVRNGSFSDLVLSAEWFRVLRATPFSSSSLSHARGVRVYAITITAWIHFD